MNKLVDNKEWLRFQYEERNRSLQSIADELSVNRNTIRNRFIAFGIPRRTRTAHLRGKSKPAEQRAKMSAARKRYWQKHPATDEYRTKLSESRTKTGITKAGRRIFIPGVGRVLEHRYIIQQLLGRPLLSSEQVHHIDGDRLNNSLDNLVLLTNSDHQKLHYSERERDENGRFVPEVE